jgi:hypothetical protein
MQDTDAQSLAYWVWLLMNNFHEPRDSNNPSQVMRKRRDTTGKIDAPVIALDYTLKMGGVDKYDRLRASFSTRLRSFKWRFHLFTLTLDTAINNA